MRANSGTIEIERQHFARDLRTEHLPESFEHRVGARQIEDDAAVGGQTERYMMIGERDALERFCYRALLGRERLQELEARRSVEEKFANFDSRARRDRAGAGILYIAGFGCDLDAVFIGGAAGLHPQMRYAGDRGERLAAKSERTNRGQVGGAANLRGRMTAERKDRVGARHAGAVVGDRDQRRSAAQNLDAHRARARIERVLDQLLDGRRRTLDDFAGRNLAGDLFGQDVDDVVGHND